MKRSLSVATELVIVVGLAATSSALTSLTISTVRRASATPPSAPIPPKIIISDTTQVIPAGQPVRADRSFFAEQPGSARGPRTIAGYAMNFLDVQMQGNVAIINAKAFIADRRAENQYVWSVRVFKDENSKDILFQKVYDHQIFELPETRQMNATFQDEIALPLRPGNYLMEVSAYKVTPRDGLKVVRSSPKDAPRFRGPHGTALIKVGG